MKRRFGKRSKFQFHLIVTLLVVLAAILMFTFSIAYVSAKNEVLDVGGEMFTKVLKDVIGFMHIMDERVKAGEITLEEAQEIVRTYVNGDKKPNGYRDINTSKMSVDDCMYLWATSFHKAKGVFTMHPFWEGKNVWNYQVQGRYTIRETWGNIKKTGYVFRELWQNPGEPVYTFIAYQEYFSPWDWIVGCGGREEIIYERRLEALKRKFLLIGGVFFLIAIVFIYYSRRAETDRERAQKALRKAYDELEIRVKERTAEIAKANEELKEANVAAESATQAKSEFLANMSHDIRTPMNGVIAAAELALSEELSPKVEHYMKIIHSSAYSLLGLINDILDFSKIEAGKLDLNIRPFGLEEIFDRVMDVFISKAVEKEIELLIDIDKELPMVLFGDPLRLQQILVNLVNNSVKFTEKGGVIIMGAKDFEIAPRQTTLSFFVKDTGIGIAPEYLPKIFEPFSQEDSSSTRKYGGAGLGLSICRKLVELMGGKLWVESELGIGSTFSFTITFSSQPVEKERKFVPPPDIQGLNVLVVDDCKASVMIMQKMLESFGFQVESVSSGTEALNILKENEARKKPFDLVLIDWLMPELDGIEVSRRIRKDLKLALPIILITAFGKESEMVDAQKAGVNAFLTKPIFQSTLFNAIMDAFGKEALEKEREKKPITTMASIYMKRLKGVRILVAEDNPTNREIALAILEKAGIVAETVENGIKAVEAVKKNQFDAVLMDIQMPQMDGYEATRVIRKDERFTSLPIIAMTAHAMKGDEEKCLEAGMDGYVSKPINQDRLFHTLWESIEAKKSAPQLMEPEAGGPEPEKLDILVTETGDLPVRLPGIDIQDALNALNIDKITFKRILTGFLKNNQDTIDKIRDSLARKDWESLRQLAHSLKGSAGNIRAMAVYEAAQKLEIASIEEATRPLAATLIDNLETALNQVLESLQSV